MARLASQARSHRAPNRRSGRRSSGHKQEHPRRSRRFWSIGLFALMVPALALGISQYVGQEDPTPSGDSISLVRGTVPGPWTGSERGLRQTLEADQDSTVTGVKFRAVDEAPNRYLATFWSPDKRLLTWAVTEDKAQDGWLSATFRTEQAAKAKQRYTVIYWAWPGKYSGKPVVGDDVSILKTTSGPIDTPTTAPTTPTTPATTKPGHSPKPTTTAPSAPKPPGTEPKPSGGFPNASNTGVPSGTNLGTYSGPCRITAANTVIDAKKVTCTLDIAASGVKVTRSHLEGGVTASSGGTGSVTISDSEISVAPNETGIGDANFVVERANIYGGNRGVNCYNNCVVRDSYIHGTRLTGSTHASGMRAGMNTVYEHNTISCDAQDNAEEGGCSADLTMYGDFSPVENVTIKNNLLMATPGGYCAYGGSLTSKPYPIAKNVAFTGNVFQRGKGGKCGYWGAITSFSSSASGAVWSGNTWDDKSVTAAAN